MQLHTTPSHGIDQLPARHGAPPFELSDDALNAAGIVKVQAFVRSGQSANAKRAKKHRALQAQEGHRQLNVVAPASAHEAIKGIAAHVKNGGDIQAALEWALDSVRKDSPSPKPPIFVNLRNKPSQRQPLVFRTWQRLRGTLMVIAWLKRFGLGNPR